jgi:hypothetical protein
MTSKDRFLTVYKVALEFEFNSLHHPVLHFSDISENRSKSAIFSGLRSQCMTRTRCTHTARANLVLDLECLFPPLESLLRPQEKFWARPRLWRSRLPVTCSD